MDAVLAAMDRWELVMAGGLGPAADVVAALLALRRAVEALRDLERSAALRRIRGRQVRFGAASELARGRLVAFFSGCCARIDSRMRTASTDAERAVCLAAVGFFAAPVAKRVRYLANARHALGA